MEEEFKPVVGFSKYIVSSNGHIKSDPSKGRKLRGLPLKPSTAKNGGYHFVTLMSDENRPRTMRVARVVCEAFHGQKPSPRHHVAHNNGNSSDHRSQNVRWATPEENQADRILHGTDIRGEAVACAKLTNGDIPIIRRLLVNHVPLHVVASAFQVDTNAIFLIKKGKTWKHIQ